MQRETHALIAVGVLGILTILGGCSKAKEAAQQAQQVREAAKASEELREEGRTEVQTEEGTVEIAEGEAVGDLEIPVYPGAQQQDATEINMPKVQGMKAQYTSGDTFDDVAGFYKGEFPDAKTGEVSEASGKRFMLSAQEDNREYGIVVRKEAGEELVHIELVQKVTKETE